MSVKKCLYLAGLLVSSVFFCHTKNQKDSLPGLPVLQKQSTDLIIFSFDRPMQLYAYLESLQAYVSGLNKKFVLYRTSDDVMAKAYQKVFASFPEAIPFKQTGKKPAESFKPLLNEIFFKQSACEYVMFGVDDIIVTDFFATTDCVAALEKTGALGFYLRLGKNITEDYARDVKNIAPPALQEVAPGVLQWSFDDACSKQGWNYKMSVDMTIYKKSDIAEMVCSGKYKAPNSFELAMQRLQPKGGYGLCFEHSMVVNVPTNLVQEERFKSSQVAISYRNMASYSTQDLLKLFNDGYKIDIQPLFLINNASPHMEYQISFVKRHLKKNKKKTNKKLVDKPVERGSSAPYISGDSFRALADIVLDETNKPWSEDVASRVKQGDVVFVKTDYLDEFFTMIHPHIAHRYVLITHNSDFSVPGNFAQYLDDSKLIAWFGENVTDDHHSKLYPIPLGICNTHWKYAEKIFDEAHKQSPNTVRDILLYLNFSLKTYSGRELIQNIFTEKKLGFVAKRKSFRSYLKDLVRSRFVLSPRGNGLDCYRTWEALYMGAIPVVESSTLNSLYEELPVFIVNDWNEVTKNSLEQAYQCVATAPYCREKLFMDYWKKKIEKVKSDALSGDFMNL